jgi:hypothetical protein
LRHEPERGTKKSRTTIDPNTNFLFQNRGSNASVLSKKLTINHQKKKIGILSTQKKCNSWIFHWQNNKNVRAKTKTKFTINCSSIKLVLKNSKK